MSKIINANNPKKNEREVVKVINKSFDEFISQYVKKEDIEKLIDELEVIEENNRPDLTKRYDLYITRGFSSGLIFSINKIKELLDRGADNEQSR